MAFLLHRRGSRTPDLRELREPFFPVLDSMYRGEKQTGLDGQLHEIDEITRVSVEKGMWLRGLALRLQARKTLEVGLAYGFSALFFLSTGAEHTAIDPWENDGWRGIGLARVRDVRGEGHFRFIEKQSVIALPELCLEGAEFDVIFIDGNHRFDDALVDFTLATPLCKRGGVVVFDDLWMPSIQKVVAFVKENRRDFREFESSTETLAFQRIGDDQRPWDFHRKF